MAGQPLYPVLDLSFFSVANPAALRDHTWNYSNEVFGIEARSTAWSSNTLSYTNLFACCR